MSRLAEPNSFKVEIISRPRSLFQLAEEKFSSAPPIRRLFSLCRRSESESVVIEDVPAQDCVASENHALLARFPDCKHVALKRISFWKKKVEKEDDLKNCKSADCQGYALLKQDIVPSQKYDRWHVFEAVIPKYQHHHNYCPVSSSFKFRAVAKEFEVKGCLYAQQNTLNKACAQVALRSLLATRLARPEFSYEEIDAFARELNPSFLPKNGLKTNQISHVLTRFGVDHLAMDYTAAPGMKTDFPFQKIIYSGIESGSGALLAFSLSGPNAPQSGHIIPCFGHTFNEDAWAPQADSAYFRIGEVIKYIPSRAWLSSFIVHDDNFGANFCIPHSFLRPEQVRYAVELYPPKYAYSGAEAEIASADYFYSLLPNLLDGLHQKNPWIRRLLEYVCQQKLILRSVAVSKTEYLDFIKSEEDWDGNREMPETVSALKSQGPDELWMIEVSIPELFSTNKRKLGEILLDAKNPIASKANGQSFVLARFPERYVFFDKLDKSGKPNFLTAPSNFKSHLSLLCR